MATSTELSSDDPATAAPADVDVPRSGAAVTTPWWRDVPSVAVLLTLLLVGLPFTHAAGGRDPYVLTWGLLVLAAAAVAVRPWRAWRALDLLALAPAAAGLLASFLTPTRFDGTRELAGLAFAGLLFLLVRGYLALGGRTSVVLWALLVAGFDQVVRGWWVWYGSQDTDQIASGTFYWHNQFAVFAAALGIFAGVLALRADGRVRIAACAFVVVSIPAVLWAASLATLGISILAWLVLAAVALRDRRSAALLVLLPLAGIALTAIVGSSLFMADPGAPWSPVQTRAESGTASSSSSSRAAYFDAAATLIERHPVTGSGFGSFGGASQPLMPANVIPTEYVHNGFLQAFVNGGVALGAAMLAVVLVPAVVGWRRLYRARLGRRRDAADAVTLAAYAGFGVLVAHSAYDFDWTYPTLLALLAVFAALIVRPPLPVATTERAVSSRTVAVSALLVLLVALPISVRAGALARSDLGVPGWARAASLGLPVTDPPRWAEGISSCRNRVIDALEEPNRRPVPAADIACLSRAGDSQPRVQMLRATALVHDGRVAEGEALARGLVDAHAERVPQLLVAQALLAHENGDDAASIRALEVVVADPRVVATPESLHYAQESLKLLRAGPTTAVPGA